jgi:hypothetical protein
MPDGTTRLLALWRIWALETCANNGIDISGEIPHGLDTDSFLREKLEHAFAAIKEQRDEAIGEADHWKFAVGTSE